MQLEKSYREELNHAGYDLEEEYFHRVNAELIARMRADRSSGYQYRLARLRAVPSPPPTKLDRFMNLVFKPLPTGIYSFPV